MSWLATTLPATVLPAGQAMQNLENQGETPEEAFATVYTTTWEETPQATGSLLSQAPKAIASAIGNALKPVESWLIWLGIAFLAVIALIIAIKLL
jgi:hypothetical protein